MLYKFIPPQPVIEKDGGQEYESGKIWPACIDIAESDGVSWREAKKQLREFYLNKAKSLRNVTEKEYFQNA